MVLRVQGVGAGQPRTIIVPFDVLLADPSLEPDSVGGHGFEAEVEPDPDSGSSGPKRWLVRQITFAARRVLRDES